MSRRIQILTKNLNLDLTMDSTLVFIGANKDAKREILNTFLQMASKYVDENQGNLVSQTGKILFDGTEVSNRNTDIIYLDEYYSLYKELILKKSYFLFEEVLEIGSQIPIITQIEEINDQMSKFELLMNQSLHEKYPELSLDLPYFSHDALIKKFAALKLDRELITSRKMIETFIKLVSRTISQSGNRVWIILDGIDRHLSQDDFKYLYDSLVDISRDTQRLNVILFNVDYALWRLNIALEDFIVVYKEIQQLYPINEMYQSIEKHYPDSFIIDEENLQQRILTVIPYIGYSEVVSLSNKNMVILKVLKKLLGDETKIETSFESLSSLEKLFLED